MWLITKNWWLLKKKFGWKPHMGSKFFKFYTSKKLPHHGEKTGEKNFFTEQIPNFGTEKGRGPEKAFNHSTFWRTSWLIVGRKHGRSQSIQRYYKFHQTGYGMDGNHKSGLHFEFHVGHFLLSRRLFASTTLSGDSTACVIRTACANIRTAPGSEKPETENTGTGYLVGKTKTLIY